MVNVRNPFKRQTSVDATTMPTLEQRLSDEREPEDVKSPLDEKDEALGGVEQHHEIHNPWDHVAAEDLDENGKERAIEVSLLRPPSSPRCQ